MKAANNLLGGQATGNFPALICLSFESSLVGPVQNVCRTSAGKIWF